MNKKEIQPFDYAQLIMNALKKGILLTTTSELKTNSMVISWGALGIEWNKPIFTVYVRQNRFTHQLLNANREFTINIPLEGKLPNDILKVCGTQSGHDIDKIQTLGLTCVPGMAVNVPAIAQVPLTLECKVIYQQIQDKEAIGEQQLKAFYPQDIPSEYHGSNCDFHTAFYGEIVKAYILEP